MSRYIATRAIRGATQIVNEFDGLLTRAIAEKGPDTPISFPNTAYYLPFILGMTGQPVEKLGDLRPVLDTAKRLLHPVPPDRRWTPYLGQTLDAGMATLFAEEGIEAVRFIYGEEPQRLPGFKLAGGTSFTNPEFQKDGDGHLNGPIDDIQLRSWGIQLVDGRMPGFAAIVGCAKSNEVAVKIVRELQRRNILTFLSGNVNGRSIIHQLMEEGVELGYDTYTVPFGLDTISAIYALGFAARSALTFGGMKGGMARDILLYNKNRVFAFVLALGEVDDLKYATAAGAINFGFPVVADTVIPEILPTGVTTYEHVVSLPFNEIEGQDDLERAEKLVQKCIEVRGVKIKLTEVPVPVPYGSAFEGEVVRKNDMRIEFGGKHSRCFEYLRMADFDEVQDGKVTVVGPDFADQPAGAAIDMGIVVDVAGRKMQKDFEPVLERQIHHFVNGASGIQHIGQRDIAWIRISKAAADKGFNLRHFGDILHTRFHADFGAIVDKVQVTIYTEPAEVEKWLGAARAAYDERNVRLGNMTDESVEEFYSCTLCLPGDQTVTLANGAFMPIERLVDTAVNEGTLTALTFDGAGLTKRPVGEVFINPTPHRLVRVTLGNGNRVTLTANHKVLLDTAEGLIWRPAGELAVGDMLLEGRKTALVTDGRPRYVIDYLPDDYRVADNTFLRERLKPALLARYGGLTEAARAVNIPYERLYNALYERDDMPHQRLTLAETKQAVTSAGLDWEALKREVHTFQGGAALRRVGLDEDLLYLAGLVAADGSIRWRGEDGRSGCNVQFTNTEPALIQRFAAICEGLFGEPPKIYSVEPKVAISGNLRVEGKRPVQVAYVYNTLLCRLLAGLGVGEPRQEAKWRGDVISGLPAPLVSAFLRGLFDGDGHVSGRRAFFTARTYGEAQHVHLLLKILGIESYLSPIARGYQVGIGHATAFEAFRQRVGAHHPLKRQRLQAATLPQDSRHVVRSDVVPLSCGRWLDELLTAYAEDLRLTQLPVDYKTIAAWRAGQRRASKVKLAQLLDALRPAIPADDARYSRLAAWSQADLSFHKVKKVERVKANGDRVYNFSVADTHNYLANGIVVKNCQSFAPNHLCIVTPERLGLCGAYNWLDCKASYQINPTGPNQPIKKSSTLDPTKGYWQGTNEFTEGASHQQVHEVAVYSIMENPMTACGCFECIAMVIPEANGVMILSREDTSMSPAGMTFSTLAGMAGGGLQTPGIMGHGKFYIISPKFISADGGFKRVVWMSSILKEQMAEQLKKVAEREGDPDLIDKICDERIATDVEGLVAYITEKNHPALSMPSLL